ncbi:MAG: chromosome partitioning protein ParB [bacterium]|nr:chromosome partitioning protein ParB [bacterium]
MTEQVELSSIDLRYQAYRIRNQYAEKCLLQSIVENGIRDPLQGIDTKDSRILLNGFKRYRCAKKLSMGIVPYCSLSNDEALGILELLRIANAKSLTILEQARLIDELRSVYGMSNTDIAGVLEKSKAWVSVRTGLLGEMTPYVLDKIMRGIFPAYSWLYAMRQFMRVNSISKEEVENFVRAVAGKGLSTRDIETLAHGYFKGSQNLRQQIISGKVSWALGQMKQSQVSASDCSKLEQAMLRDLEIVQKYMCRIIAKSQDDRHQSPSFYAQSNLLSGGILRNMASFSTAVKACHDQSRQA